MEGISTFVGIDISKNSLDVHILPEAQSLKVPNKPQGFQQLLDRLPKPQTCLIVVEATGGSDAGGAARFRIMSAMGGNLPLARCYGVEPTETAIASMRFIPHPT